MLINLCNSLINIICFLRSKIKSSKHRPENQKLHNYKIDDLFGTAAYPQLYPSKYPTTVPLIKDNTRDSINHLFIKSDLLDNKPNHSSANVLPRRRPSQQEFVSNNNFIGYQSVKPPTIDLRSKHHLISFPWEMDHMMKLDPRNNELHKINGKIKYSILNFKYESIIINI